MVLGLIFVSRMFLGVLLEAQGFLFWGGGCSPLGINSVSSIQYSTVQKNSDSDKSFCRFENN